MPDFDASGVYRGVRISLLIIVIWLVASSIWRAMADGDVRASAATIASKVEKAIAEHKRMLVTTWRVADGSTEGVQTPREANEAQDVWEARHDAIVVSRKAKFPPVQ